MRSNEDPFEAARGLQRQLDVAESRVTLRKNQLFRIIRELHFAKTRVPSEIADLAHILPRELGAW
jgi:hypothetical protein